MTKTILVLYLAVGMAAATYMASNADEDELAYMLGRDELTASQRRVLDAAHRLGRGRLAGVRHRLGDCVATSHA